VSCIVKKSRVSSPEAHASSSKFAVSVLLQSCVFEPEVALFCRNDEDRACAWSACNRTPGKRRRRMMMRVDIKNGQFDNSRGEKKGGWLTRLVGVSEQSLFDRPLPVPRFRAPTVLWSQLPRYRMKNIEKNLNELQTLKSLIKIKIL